MRQSGTAPDTGADWMDQEREWNRQFHPEKFVISPGPWPRLTGLRNELLQRVVASVCSRGRLPHVCLYALAFHGCAPRASLDAAAAYAEERSWRVRDGRAFTDPYPPDRLRHRPGWNRVLEQIRGGYADGVVVITTDVVTTDPDEYEQELARFQAVSGFIAVTAPDVAVRR
ncbi:hypothetical protein ACFYXM_10705 [Streptomyces sp. NPDC002476]|uniref:hypothetical protein n=1 Tax=Streptomyces sp. NPDC002476 TaxID=3364648 RepID=UPI0036CCE1C0